MPKMKCPSEWSTVSSVAMAAPNAIACVIVDCPTALLSTCSPGISGNELNLAGGVLTIVGNVMSLVTHEFPHAASSSHCRS